MRGLDQLRRMRLARYRPSRGAVIVVHDGEMPAPIYAGINIDTTAEIEIGAADRIDRMDLRCLVGLRVVVTRSLDVSADEAGSADKRIAAVAQAVSEAGASAVIGVEYVRSEGAAYERRIAEFNPWTTPEKSWLN